MLRKHILKLYVLLEIKLWGLGFRIRFVEASWFLVQNRNQNNSLCGIVLIVCDSMFPLPLEFCYSKLKIDLIFFWGWKRSFLSYVIMQDICNKFIEVNFFWCMVWPWLRLLHHWTFVKYWLKISKNYNFLTPLPLYKCQHNIWMVPK